MPGLIKRSFGAIDIDLTFFKKTKEKIRILMVHPGPTRNTGLMRNSPLPMKMMMKIVGTLVGREPIAVSSQILNELEREMFESFRAINSKSREIIFTQRKVESAKRENLSEKILTWIDSQKNGQSKIQVYE